MSRAGQPLTTPALSSLTILSAVAWAFGPMTSTTTVRNDAIPEFGYFFLSVTFAAAIASWVVNVAAVIVDRGLVFLLQSGAATNSLAPPKSPTPELEFGLMNAVDGITF